VNKAVIFDMDGVICHTNPFHCQAFDIILKKRGISATDEEYQKHMYGKNNRYIFSYFLNRPIEGQELLDLEDEKEGLFREIYEAHVQPIDGFMECFLDLKNHGFMTGVATSAPRANLDLILSKVPIKLQMESILASENVTKHKPDPEVYNISAKNLATDNDKCIVFEDSYSGVSAAINAKMKVVGVLSSHTKEELPPCDFYIDDYFDIDIDIIKNLIIN
jgi:beta-phosphoglucomutase